VSPIDTVELLDTEKTTVTRVTKVETLIRQSLKDLIVFSGSSWRG